MDMTGAAAGGDVVPVVPAAAFPTSLDGRKDERGKKTGSIAQESCIRVSRPIHMRGFARRTGVVHGPRQIRITSSHFSRIESLTVDPGTPMDPVSATALNFVEAI